MLIQGIFMNNEVSGTGEAPAFAPGGWVGGTGCPS